MTACKTCEADTKRTLFHDKLNELHDMLVCRSCDKWLNKLVANRSKNAKLVTKQW